MSRAVYIHTNAINGPVRHTGRGRKYDSGGVGVTRYWSRGPVNTKCPYYIRDSEYAITCSGLEHGTECATRFRSESDKERFQEKHCFMYDCKCWCTLAKLLEQKVHERDGV